MTERRGAVEGGDQPTGSVGRQRLSTVIQRYLNHFAVGSSHTARAKRLDGEAFLLFLARETKQPRAAVRVGDWSYASTVAFVESLLRKGEAPATVARRLATLKHLGRTLAERVAGFVNPARDVRSPKIQPTRPKAVPESELRRLRRALDENLGKNPSYKQLRDRLVVVLLMETGLRVDEVCQLRSSQLDPDIRWLRSVRTKGRKFRNVYLPTGVRDDIRRYLGARDGELKRRLSQSTHRERLALPLFLSFYGVGRRGVLPLSSRTVWRLVRRLSSTTKLHPHLLRHSFALDLLADSKDIRLVAQALGHADVRTTMRYTERRDQEVAVALERSRGKRQGR